MTKEFTLQMSGEHVRVLSNACECYMRLLMGQLRYVADHALREMGDRHEDMRTLRDEMEKLGPLISGYPIHASKGIFNETLHEDAKIAHDIKDVVNYHAMNLGRWEPMRASKFPLPIVEPKGDA